MGYLPVLTHVHVCANRAPYCTTLCWCGVNIALRPSPDAASIIAPRYGGTHCALHCAPPCCAPPIPPPPHPRYERDQPFEQVQVNSINAAQVVDGKWYVVVKGDYAGRVHGFVYDISNSTTPKVGVLGG